MSEENTQTAEAQNTNTTTRQRDEATIKRQILTNVKKSLAKLAEERAKVNGKYEAPTNEEVAAECKKRGQERLDRMKGKEDISVYFD